MSDTKDITPSKVVIERRGGNDIVWSTEKGLVNVSWAPFGVLGMFEGEEVLQEIVSWFEISHVRVFDLRYEKEPVIGPVTACAQCKGRGLIDDGDRRCSACDGWGYDRPDVPV